MFFDQSCSFGMRQLVGFHASQPRQLLSMSGYVKCNFTVNKIHFETFVPCCAKKNVNTANTSYGCEDYIGCFCTSALASRLMPSASFSRSNTSKRVFQVGRHEAFFIARRFNSYTFVYRCAVMSGSLLYVFQQECSQPVCLNPA